MFPIVKWASHLASWLQRVFKSCLKSICPHSWCSQTGPECNQWKWVLSSPLQVNQVPRVRATSGSSMPTWPPGEGGTGMGIPGPGYVHRLGFEPYPHTTQEALPGLHGQERSWRPAWCFPAITSSLTWSVLSNRPCPSISGGWQKWGPFS